NLAPVRADNRPVLVFRGSCNGMLFSAFEASVPDVPISGTAGNISKMVSVQGNRRTKVFGDIVRQPFWFAAPLVGKERDAPQIPLDGETAVHEPVPSFIRSKLQSRP